jgi:hypothetical protein
MIIFVDESGDTGIKLEKGASSIFVLGGIVFTEEGSTAKFESRLAKWISKRKHLAHLDELKFSKLDKGKRLEVIDFLFTQKGDYFVVFVDKRILPFLKRNSILSRCYATLAETIGVQKELTLVIDGKVSENEKRVLKQVVLPLFGGSKLKVKWHDSRSNRLIQISDIVVGVFATCLLKKPGYEQYEFFLDSIKILQAK